MEAIVLKVFICVQKQKISRYAKYRHPMASMLWVIFAFECENPGNYGYGLSCSVHNQPQQLHSSCSGNITCGITYESKKIVIKGVLARTSKVSHDFGPIMGFTHRWNPPRPGAFPFLIIAARDPQDSSSPLLVWWGVDQHLHNMKAEGMPDDTFICFGT